MDKLDYVVVGSLCAGAAGSVLLAMSDETAQIAGVCAWVAGIAALTVAGLKR